MKPQNTNADDEDSLQGKTNFQLLSELYAYPAYAPPLNVDVPRLNFDAGKPVPVPRASKIKTNLQLLSELTQCDKYELFIVRSYPLFPPDAPNLDPIPVQSETTSSRENATENIITRDKPDHRKKDPDRQRKRNQTKNHRKEYPMPKPTKKTKKPTSGQRPMRSRRQADFSRQPVRVKSHTEPQADADARAIQRQQHAKGARCANIT
jgi:hypothetical protein